MISLPFPASRFGSHKAGCKDNPMAWQHYSFLIEYPFSVSRPPSLLGDKAADRLSNIISVKISFPDPGTLNSTA